MDFKYKVDEDFEDKGYFILACGNLYKNSEEIELGTPQKDEVVSLRNLGDRKPVIP
jgi:hypothetical protein